MKYLVNERLPITVITVVFNDVAGLKSTITSLESFRGIIADYIVIDGDSNDGSKELIAVNSGVITQSLSERDKGIYDAMNKGWNLAKNNTYVLFLGAGDKVISLPSIDDLSKDADVIFGDVQLDGRYTFVGKADVRLKLGNTLHHQALLVKKTSDLTSPFDLSFRTYADYDFSLRLFLQNKKFIRSNSFEAFAADGGVSFDLNGAEMSRVVAKNLGPFWVAASKLYYALQALKNARRSGHESKK